MKVTAFRGSPRRNGNTDLLLNQVIKTLKPDNNIIEFTLNKMSIKPCQNCGGCEKSGCCVMTDDMQDIYSAIRESDRIILSSPIFFFALSAQAKIMIDRCQAFWCEKYLLKRPIAPGPHGRKGLLLLVGGMKKDVGIQCAGSTATAFLRTISVPEHDVLAYLGVDSKGAIRKHPTAFTEAREAGIKLIGGNTPLQQ